MKVTIEILTNIMDLIYKKKIVNIYIYIYIYK